MAVRFRSADEQQVRLRCQEPQCPWSKMLYPDQVHASLLGHYSYKHPERRPPDQRDARRAAGL